MQIISVFEPAFSNFYLKYPDVQFLYLKSDARFQLKLKRWSKIFLSAIVAIAVMSLVGWRFDIDILRSPLSSVGAMSPVASILFIISGISFFLVTRKNMLAVTVLPGRGLALIVLFAGTTRLISFLASSGFNPEYFFYYPDFANEASIVESIDMAPLTSVCFLLTGLSLFFLNTEWKGNRTASQFLAIFIQFAAAFSVVGYLYNVKSFSGLKVYYPMAVYSTVCFILISLAILFANPARGVMKQFTSIHSGSTTARVVIPTMLLVPVVFGLLFQYVTSPEHYGQQYYIILFVLATMIFHFVALWYNTVLLNKRDIQKAQTENALKESREQVQAIFRSAPDAVIIINEDGRILQWNRQSEILFGWTEQEAWYKPFTSLILPSRYFDRHKAAIEQSLHTARTTTGKSLVEIRSFKKNGEEIDIALSLSSSMVNGKYLFVAFIRDITEKKRTEIQLRHFNKMLEEQVKEKAATLTGIFERITDAFIALDKNYCFTYVNKKAGQLIQHQPEALIGKFFWDIFPGTKGSATYKAFNKAMNEQCYVVNVGYDEQLDLWQENHIYPSPDGLSVFIRDISERKKAEQEIRQQAIQLQAISNSLPGMMTYQMIRERDGRMQFTYLGGGVTPLTGKTPQQVLQDPQILYDLVDEDDRLKIQKAKETSCQTMSLVDVVIRAKDYSGDTRWLHIRSAPRKLNDGRIAWDGVYMDITDTIAKEKQISEKEAQLRLFVENSPAAIAMLDVNQRYIMVSRQWIRDYDLGAVDIIGKCHYEIFPETPLEWKVINQRCLGGLIYKGEEDIFIRKNGTKAWIRREVHPWYTISGEVGGIILLTEFITAKKIAEEEVKSSNERFKMMAQATHDALWEWNLRENTLWSNQAHQELYGLALTDPVPGHEEWVSRIHPDDKERVVNSFTKTLQSSDTIWFEEYRFQTNHGIKHIYDRTSIIRNERAEPIRMMGSMMDMTKIKTTQKELMDYKYALDQSSIVAVTDNKGIINYVNDNFCRISKYTAEELIGQNHRIVNSGYHSKSFFRNLWATVSKGKIWRGEVCNKTKDNSIYWVDTTIVPFLNETGRPYQYVVIRSDITEKKKAEGLLKDSLEDVRRLASHLETVREQERIAMAREIHDELGQQLTVLKMDISWLNKNLSFSNETQTQRMRDLLQTIDTTIKTVRRISSELRPSVLDDLGLIAALEWLLRDFEKRSGIKTKFISAINDMNLELNSKTALFRVFQETLTNVARHAQATEVNAELAVHDNDLLIVIKDNGIGFDPGSVENKKTLGILGIKERIGLINGIFKIDSTLNEGTTIMIKVPVKQETEIKQK